MLYVRFPLSLRNVEDLLHERGIDVSHETIRYWWNRFGPIFAAEIRRKRARAMRARPQWQWRLDEVFVKINGETYYLWRAVDHEGEVLEAFVSRKRDRKAALKFLRKTLKNYGRPKVIVTDKLRSYGAAMKVIGCADRQETGRWLNNRAENSHQPFRRRERAMLRFRALCEVCRNSPPFIRPSRIISTRSAASTAETISSLTAPPLATGVSILGGLKFSYLQELMSARVNLTMPVRGLQFARLQLAHEAKKGPKPIWFSIDSAEGEERPGDAVFASLVATNLKRLEAAEMEVLVRHGRALTLARLHKYAPELLV